MLLKKSPLIYFISYIEIENEYSIGVDTVEEGSPNDNDLESFVDTSCDAFDFEEEEIMKYHNHLPKGTQNDLVPSSIAVARTIQGQSSARLLKVLFDSGGTKTFINSKCLPKGATPSLLSQPLQGITAAGRLVANRVVHLEQIVLPEFSRSKKIDEHI